MSQFSPELCKLESSNVVYILCRMSDCIVGLRLRVMVFIFSSPEHEVLMVSCCDQSLSVVRALSTFYFKQLLLQNG